MGFFERATEMERVRLRLHAEDSRLSPRWNGKRWSFQVLLEPFSKAKSDLLLRKRIVSISEIGKPLLSQSQDNRENHSGCDTKQEHSIAGFQRSQHSPARGQKHVSIAQRREVDRGVVVRSSHVRKFTAEEEYDRP